MDILLSQALWILGFLAADQLVGIGIKGLQHGLDSTSLRLLASLSENEAMEAPVLFTQALKELGFPVIGRPEAARIYASEISRQILKCELSPKDGANILWDASIRVNEPGFHDLDTFIYAASELQSRPEDREFFIREIEKEAGLWAAKLDKP